MSRAAIPYMWAQSCQERLDFWNFIQELGGVNSYHVKLALAREKEKWEKEKKEEINALTITHQREVQDVKKQAAGDAMEKLTGLLLGDGEINVAAAKAQPKAAKPQANAKVEATPKAAPKAKAPVKNAEPKPDSKEDKMEAYVDSFMCTSCNDCTEKFPPFLNTMKTNKPRLRRISRAPLSIL
jgi:hypothetical protein